jgi:WD40 repeat protein
MDTRQVVARFEAERQALAMMDHPSIARVYDAGATDQGRPYFAMELIKGIPITDYCDKNKLRTRKRLELFALVCEGVQHAHQKGIIHRDIKPSNVLVTIQDDRPVPKIIDFGVAKAMDQRLTEKTLFTELGQLIGTPEYMSPEQAEMTGLDIDTRTDVYSLGVLLYELLSGALPFEARDLRKAGYDEIRRKIREDEPSKPSTRISSLGDDATTAARNRATAPGTIVRRLRGDLDWITMKALEKDRTRRYGSPSDLAADISRHLQSEPVLAGAPSTAYKMKKFVRRNRLAVTAAGIVLAALVLGVVGTTFGMVRARLEARRAEASNLFAIGQTILEKNPSGALAYATASLELADQAEVREFAMRVLWRGPTSFVDPVHEFSLYVEFSPDGKRLAAGGWNGFHKLWKPDGVASIAPRLPTESTESQSVGDAQISPHERDEVVWVGFSADGQYHVSASDKGLRIWSVPDAKELRYLELQPWWFGVRGESLLTLTLADDGERLVGQRWPLAGGNPTSFGEWRRPSSLSDPFALMRFDVDPDGVMLAYAEGPDVFELPLDKMESAAPRRLVAASTDVGRILYHPDGRRIATFERIDESSGVIRLWSRSSGSDRPLRSFQAPIPDMRDLPAVRMRKIRFDPGGKWMAAINMNDLNILLWDLSAPPGTQPMALRTGETSGVTMAAVHPDGAWLAIGDRRVSVLPLSRTWSHTLLHDQVEIMGVAFDPGGKWLVSTSWDGKLRLWTLKSSDSNESRILFDSKRHPIFHPTVSPDGSRVAAGLWDGHIVVVDVKSGTSKELIGFGSAAYPTFDRDGRRVAAAGGWKLGSDAVIRIWDSETGEVLHVLDPGDRKALTGVVFMPDGRLLSGGFGGLRIWDIESGTSELIVSEPMMFPALHGQYVLGVRMVYDSNGSYRGVAVVHDLQSGRSRVLESHGVRIWQAVWHPSGEQVVTTDRNGAIRVGLVGGDEPHLLVGHEMRPYVSVHPNGSMIASAGPEGALRLWPMPEGQPFNALPPDELVDRLHSLTNYRIVRDTESFTGYRLDLGPFPGWKDLPTW